MHLEYGGCAHSFPVRTTPQQRPCSAPFARLPVLVGCWAQECDRQGASVPGGVLQGVFTVACFSLPLW